MQKTETLISESGPSFPGIVNKIVPLVQMIAPILFCVIAWYVATQTNSFAQNSRLDALEKRAEAADRTMGKVLTKEVYEAYRKGDVERADRMEKMLLQLIDQNKK